MATPEWFEWALAQTPIANNCISDGKRVEYLQWAPPMEPASRTSRVAAAAATAAAGAGAAAACALHTSKRAQGIILVHGAMAHAHWWDHVGPHLAGGCSGLYFDVVAITHTGNGRSDQREAYTCDILAREIIAVGEAAGFYDLDREALPVVVGHSLGSYFSERAVQMHPEKFSGLIIADGGIPHPVVWSDLGPDDPPPWRRPAGTKHRVYPPTTTPETRFRLSPPQTIRHPCIVDHIARQSIKQAPGAPAGHWLWAVDPDHSSKSDSFVMLAHTVGTPAAVRTLQQQVHVAVIVGR